MLRHSLILPLALALSVATTAAAQDRSAQTDAGVERSVKTGDPDRRVCKATATTGTRLSRAKVCKTAREWADEQARTQEELQRSQVSRGQDGG